MLKKTMGLWNYKPVQVGLKTFAAGSAFALIVYGAKRIQGVFSGPEDQKLKQLQEKCVGSIQNDLEVIWDLDPSWIDLIARLETFRRFDNIAFDDLILHIRNSCELISAGTTSAVQSFKVRAQLQRVIESLRIFRAIVELRVPIEDFDEIAADFNSYVDSLCSDAIQNTFT